MMENDANNPVYSQSEMIRSLIHTSEEGTLGITSDRIKRVGDQVGNYRLSHLLTEGGFADVYIGEHIHLNTFAAIKMLHTRLASEELAAFREEARIIARLRHPNIISVLDFNVQDGIPFIVITYAPNGTLRQRHPPGTLLKPETIVAYIIQVADALQYAHDQHVIHRDVKPENMLVGWNNEILLSDFGIAVTQLTFPTHVHQSITGTVAYMPPEQFDGKSSPASDQYALAAVIYDWLCGRPPFVGSIAEIAVQHLNARPLPIHLLNPHISSPIEQIVLKALAKDSRERYPTMREFAIAFADACWQGSQTVPAGWSLRQSPLPTIPASGHQIFPQTQPANYAQANVLPTLYDLTRPGAANPGSPSQRRISRRILLSGMGGLGIASLLGGGLLWFLRPHDANQPHHANPRAITTAPGTLMLAYRGHTDVVNALAWIFADKAYIMSASSDHTVRVWNSDSGADTKVYSAHAASVNSVSVSLNGQKIASASNDNTVRVWNVLKGNENTYIYRKHADIVNAVSWSQAADSQEQYIVSGSNDKTVRIWRPHDGGELITYRKHNAAVNTVMWSSDGKHVASAGVDKTVHVWQPAMVNFDIPPTVIFTQHSGSVNAVVWSPDGRHIASASADNTVMVWLALIGGNPLLTYTGHNSGVNAIAWSPDGKYLASASDDGTVQIWKVSDGSILFTYNGHGANAVRSVTWSPDGHYIASAGDDQTVQVWYA